VTIEEFDQYRLEYDTIAPHRLTEWHSRLFADYPDQSHYNGGAMLHFFEGIDARMVAEIGGWDGAAAKLVLLANPEIEVWVNYEVCAEAANASVCADGRYWAIPEAMYRISPSIDTVVASHCLEHMNDAQVETFISTLHAANLYIDAPLSDDGETWIGTTCFHCLNMGWSRLDELVRAAGFKQTGNVGAEIRWYKR
jgi:hypothetical protein